MILPIVLGSFLVILFAFTVFFMRSQKSLLERDLKSVLDGAKSLRTDLMTELQSNRMELQSGLLKSTEALERKVSSLDERLNQNLGKLSEGVQNKLETNIKEGFFHFTKVQEHLKTASAQLQNLSSVGESINNLNSLLKLPHLRGGFGEAALERLLSDLLPAHAFDLQYRIVPTGTERVDAVVRFPKHVLPIDSKFPREQVLPLFETDDPQKLENARKQLSDVMKSLAKSIREKYIHPEHGTTEMALLFVPSETIYFEVLRNVKLCEDLAKLKVFTVSPNTLGVTLHSISMAREYYEMAKGVEKTIGELKRTQKHLENFENRFGEIGKSLKRAQDAFDTAGTHLDRYNSALNKLTDGVEMTSAALPSETPRLDA